MTTQAFFSYTALALRETRSREDSDHKLAWATAEWWDEAKSSLRQSYLTAAKEAKTSMTNSYR